MTVNRIIPSLKSFNIQHQHRWIEILAPYSYKYPQQINDQRPNRCVMASLGGNSDETVGVRDMRGSRVRCWGAGSGPLPSQKHISRNTLDTVGLWSNTYYFAHPNLAEQGAALGLREVSASWHFWNCQCRFVGAGEAARPHLG